MKKLTAVILAAMMVLSLTACGGSGDSALSSDQVQTPASSPAETTAPEPEEPAPSLEEIMYDVSQYAENEDMQISEDAMAVISDMYDAGTTDAYLIFEYLCSNGLCTSKSSATDGIIVLKYSPGSNRTWNSTGTYALTTFTVELDCIDPDTGAVRHLKTFSSEDTHSCSAVLDGSRSTRRRALMDFSADLSKMTATITLEDGSVHVGWIDENGNFTDVSKKVTSDAGDFGGITRHSNPCFGPDNYFYFRDLTNASTKGFSTDGAQIKRVPLNNLTISAVETMVEDDPWPGTIIYPLPDGSVNTGGYWDYYDNTMTYPARRDGDYMTDWISPNEGVGTHRTEDTDMIYKYTLSGVDDIFKWYDKLVPLVPSVSGRTNWNPIASPDASKVAFLSKLTIGTDASSYLYIVSIDGGNPVKVSTDYIFDSNSLYSTYLLTWSGADENASRGKSSITYLTTIEPTTKDEKIVLKNDSSGKSNSGEVYFHYLFSNLEGSSVVWNLDGKYSTLNGLWTICYTNRDTTTQEAFEIYADNALVYTSPVLTGGSDAVDVNVPINNCQQLKIVFTSGTGCGEFGNVTLTE